MNSVRDSVRLEIVERFPAIVAAVLRLAGSGAEARQFLCVRRTAARTRNGGRRSPAQAGDIDRDCAQARGHALRRTFKTVATAHCKVPDDVSAFLLGHVPEGMSQKYLLRWALSSGPAIREAQATISREMVRLLHRRRGKACE